MGSEFKSGFLLDTTLEPQVADIRALCNIRLLEYLQLIKDDRTYLIADWSINELSISIFSYGQLEFLRYQSFDTDLSEWKPKEIEEYPFSYHLEAEDDYSIILTDQMLEIDRIMNFFKFSLHKGEKSIDEIIILGDNPLLRTIKDLLENNFSAPIIMLNDSVVQKSFPQFSEEFASLIGLALKEVN
ncbi:type IV pilus biogenesis protein PilM [Lysinibacillus xylanilyticus]|uniref:type IV pilus biogenesis protein PilM n=1 Tax=Lysinibacillus xylanilyticus TaxID=582475 RepID=UPI0037F8379A